MTIPFDLATFAVAAVVVTGAYVIFGISAFGAALFTVPVLSHFLPLDFVLQMCALIDMAAALALGVRISRDADWSELKWMVPLSAARSGRCSGSARRRTRSSLRIACAPNLPFAPRFPTW